MLRGYAVKAKRTIWRPLALGTVLGFLSFVSSAVDFLIPLGFSGVAAGPQEIPLTMSAAIGGPLGLFVSSLLHELGIYFFLLNPEFSPGQMSSTGILFAAADFLAHVLALLTVAFCYRFLHQRTQKVITQMAGWILIIAIYYTLLVLLQSLLVGAVVPGTPPFSTLFQNFLPEFQVTLIITTLILLALPRRLRKPLWYKSQLTADGNSRGNGQEKERAL